MELVDRNSMLEKLSKFHPDYTFNITSFKNFLREEPEAVVHCKDCRYYNGEMKACAYNMQVTAEDFAQVEKGKPSAKQEIIRCRDCAKREHCRTSTVWAVAPNDDWYCADAERKEQ